MKKMHLLLYKYRVSMGIVPVVAGILYFVLDENRRFSKTMLGIGATVMSIGIVLRIWTAMYNWENINSVEPIATNGIITNGPYRYCRNPMYFSAIILTLGFSLIFGSWQVVLIAVLPTIVVHLHQIYVEERYLINICDEFYDLYKQKVPRLLPYHGKILDVITIILNFVIVGKIKSDVGKVKAIPSTAPPHVLLQPLRYVLFPTAKYINSLNMDKEVQNPVVLDLGCGPGYYSIPLAQNIDGTLIVMDIREKMLKITRDRAEKKNISNINYLKGDSSQIDLADDYVDLICINLVLGEIVKLDESIDEMARILKPTGRICVMESKFDDHFMNIEEVREIFEKKGFDSHLIEKKKTYYILQIHKK